VISLQVGEIIWVNETWFGVVLQCDHTLAIQWRINNKSYTSFYDPKETRLKEVFKSYTNIFAIPNSPSLVDRYPSDSDIEEF